MEQSNGRVEHSSLTSSALKTFDLPATGRDSARSGGGEGSAAAEGDGDGEREGEGERVRVRMRMRE